MVGDPVDVVTGAHIDLTVDFQLRGPLSLRWLRYYNSARNTVASTLGWGQTHDYDRTLTYGLDGLYYTDPFGTEVPFPPLEIGEDAANRSFLLRRLTMSRYELLQTGQPVQDFEFSASNDSTPLRRLRQRGAQINFHYAANGRLEEIIDSLGRSISVESDRDGRILGLFIGDTSAPSKWRALMRYEYDLAGNPIVGRDRYNAILGFGWDEHHRLTRRTDRRGYSFHFAYDEHGRCVHSRGDDGLLEVFLEYQPDLKTTLVRRGNGGQWIYSYDAAGTITQITDPYGGATRFTVDEAGRVTEEIDPNGNVTRLLYDGTGRHYARVDPLGYTLPTYEEDPNPPDPLAYDLPETPLGWEHGHLFHGREIHPPAPSDPAFQGFPLTVSDVFLETRAQHSPGTTDEGLNATEDQGPPVEDEEGRPVEQGAPGHLQRWKYDPNGNLAEYHDRDGAVYRYVYTSWNALHQEIDPLGHTTTFHHSSQGLVNRVQDPGGTVTEYTYDLKDRLVEVRRDGTVRERYRYDSAANIVEKTDRQGRPLVTWTIGPANLDVARRLSSGETHTFEYDARGRIITAVTPNGTATFAFDEDGTRLADQRDGLGVAHEFDRRLLVATTCFGKFRTSYRTDNSGDLVITDPTGAHHRVRLGEGGLVVRRLASGARELGLYDTVGRCRRKAVVRDGHYGTPWMRSFTYSRAGDLLGVMDNMQGAAGYHYDQAHRLVEELLPDGSRRQFRYDPAGNLLVQPGLGEVRMASGNRLHSANGDRFTYNQRDHVSSREGPTGTTRYEYDLLDRLVRCEINGENWTASYDALCRRIRKTWRDHTTTYYWDGFRLAAEVRHDGSLRVYVYEDHVALVPFMFVEYAGLNSEPSSGTRYYIFANHIGVPSRVEDDAGRSCWSARIDPYGHAHISRENSVEMPLRFPGHYHDLETGLHYNRFRYFSPELGRYLQSDPAGLEGGINVYAYPTDPLTGADIDGLAGRGGRGGSGKRPSSRASGKKGEGSPKGAGAGCPAPSPGGAPAGPRPKDPSVKVGDVGKYKDLVARGRVGDRLTPDHIPSAASLIAAENKRRKEANQRPLSKKQENEIRDNGNCVVVPHDLHVAGNTYGGKNTKDRIATDAGDPKGAETRDMQAHKDNAEDHGVDPKAMDKAAKDLKTANEADGVTT